MGRGELSVAAASRCSAPPQAVLNLSLAEATESTALITWEEPSELHGAVLLGYKAQGST